MPDTKPKLIKNAGSLRCKTCGGIHEYISMSSKDAPCGTPAGFSLTYAESWVRDMNGYSKDDIVPVPDDMVIVLDRSARRLPRGGEPRLAHYTTTEKRM
jgi:hypothetical protein